MRKYKSYGNYVVHPLTKVHGFDGAVIRGYEPIRRLLEEKLKQKPDLKAVMDIYPGVDEARLVLEFGSLPFSRIIRTSDFRLSDESLLVFLILFHSVFNSFRRCKIRH